MKISVRASLRITVIFIVALGILSLAHILIVSSEMDKLEHFSSPAKLNQGKQNQCGPWAFFVATTRQGASVSFSSILKGFHITDKGVSFGDIVKQAKEQGYLTKLTKLSWNELKRADVPVILWVDGNHFLTADPRDVHPEGEDMVHVYDHGIPAAWYSRSQLEQRWTGESLVIHKGSSTSRVGPKIKWETCLEDFGWVASSPKTHLFKYKFENIGNQPMQLSVAKVGCGCATAGITPKEIINPGEKGLVTVTVDLSKKRGYFSASVLLDTNDPSTPQCALIVSGGVLQNTLASLDTFYLGQVYRGSNLVKSFLLQDRGDKTLQIEELNVALAKNGVATDYVTCDVKSTYIQAGDLPKNLLSQYAAKPGDYLVDLSLQVAPNAPMSPFEGRVLFKANQPSRLSSGSVKFKGVIVSDIYAEPSAVLLSRSEPSVEIRLKSKLENRVEKMEFTTDVSGDIDLNIEALDTPGKDAVCRISVAKFSKAGTANGKLCFKLNDESHITVPVIVYNSKQ